MALINATSTSDGDVPLASPASAQRQAKAVGARPEPWAARSIGRWKWYFSPDWEPVLADRDAPDWLRLQADPRATLVKTSDGRQVWRVRIGSKLVFAKIALPARRWFRWRRILLGSDAARELRIADYAARHQIDTVHPIAMAEAPLNGSGPASVLITAGLANARPLNEFWSTQDPAAPSTRHIKNQVIDVTARLIAHAHQNGFQHLDLHAGNVLVQPGDDGSWRACFVDLHNIRTGRPVRDEGVARNLAQFNQWFSLHAPLSDRIRFLGRYLHWRDVVAPHSAFARRLGYDRPQLHRSLERAAHVHAAALYAKRDRRVMRTGRYFARVKLDNHWRGHVFLSAKHPVPGSRASHLSFTTTQWKNWLRQLDQHIENAPRHQIIKDSASAFVCRAQLPVDNDDPLDVIIKRAVPRNLAKRFKNTFRKSRAMWTWQRANALLNRQTSTARPLAVLERRWFGLLLDSVIITEHLAHAHDLDTVLTVQMRELTPQRQRWLKRHMIQAVVRAIRRLHDRGFVHRDLKAPNLMVQWDPRASDPPQAMLVDLDGMRYVGHPSRRACLRALMRLNVSLDHCRRVTLTDRLRFLKRFLARPGRPEPNWKPVWREIAALTEWKRRVRSRQQERMLNKYGRI
jgi:serine/threonine protein kinase